MLLGKADARLTKQPSSRQSLSPGAELDASAQHPRACRTSSPALTAPALCVPEGYVLTQCEKQPALRSADLITLQAGEGRREACPRAQLQGGMFGGAGESKGCAEGEGRAPQPEGSSLASVPMLTGQCDWVCPEEASLGFGGKNIISNIE